MKRLLPLFVLVSLRLSSFGQSSEPRQITPKILQTFKAEIERQVPQLKQRLLKQKLTTDQIEFSIDTFRIEQLISKRMDIDYSTNGMNNTVNEQTISYDKLMNKYYKKLLTKLKLEDKKILIAAQKAWLVYRDNELKLIWTMAKKEYSGGGTIQTNTATGLYSALVVKRTLEIYDYYETIIDEE